LKGGADLDTPPINSYFDANSCIKSIPKVEPMASRSTLATPQAVDNPSAPIASQNVPAIAPPSSGPPAFADMIQLLLLGQLQQQQQFANMPLCYLLQFYLL